MANTPTPQFRQNSLSQQIFLAKTHTTHGDVGQDKSASRSERSALDQPAHSRIGERSDALNTNFSRSQKEHVHSNGFVPLTIHVPCIARDEIERRAAKHGTVLNGRRKSLTLSAVARPIFLKGLQSDIDLQYGAMLEPIIARAIKHETRSLRALLMLVLTRIAFDAGQTRAVATNILARQPGITQAQLDEILDKSGDTSLANITRITPQISEGMQSINKLL